MHVSIGFMLRARHRAPREGGPQHRLVATTALLAGMLGGLSGCGIEVDLPSAQPVVSASTSTPPQKVLPTVTTVTPYEGDPDPQWACVDAALLEGPQDRVCVGG